MIRELKLTNIEMDSGEKNIIAQNVQGKILKVLFKPSTGNHGVRLRIFTKEGEQVMDVTQEGVYYPRSNVSSEKMLGYTYAPEGDHKDYYYINEALFFNLTTQTDFEGFVVDELVLIYEDTRNLRQINLLSQILQRISLNQIPIEELENGRR